MMEEAKKALETKFGKGCVLAGFMACASPGHVKQKCGDMTIASRHRIAMANLVSKETGWILPTDACYGYCVRCIEVLAPRVLGGSINDYTIVEVCGGDRAHPERDRGHFRVFVGRHQYTEDVKKRFGGERDVGGFLYKENHILIDKGKFLIVCEVL